MPLEFYHHMHQNLFIFYMNIERIISKIMIIPTFIEKFILIGKKSKNINHQLEE